jgi:hypothetical protein
VCVEGASSKEGNLLGWPTKQMKGALNSFLHLVHQSLK